MAGTCTGPGVASLGVGVGGILGISIGLGVGSIVVGPNGVGGMVVLTGEVNMFLLGTYSVLPTDAGVSGPATSPSTRTVMVAMTPRTSVEVKMAMLVLLRFLSCSSVSCDIHQPRLASTWDGHRHGTPLNSSNALAYLGSSSRPGSL